MSSSAADKILKLEKDNPLLYTYEYKGVPVWELIRYPIFLSLSKYSATLIKKSFIDRSVARLKNFFYTFIIANPLFFISKKKVLIFRCSRKNKYEGRFIDLYTDHIERLYPANEVGTYETEGLYSNRTDSSPSIRFFMVVSSFLASLLYKISKPDEAGLAEVKSILSASDVKIDPAALFYKQYLQFRAESFFYSVLLKLRSPGQIYLVNYIDKLALIAEAKKKGITVHEMQHGFTSPSLLLYHYPYTPVDHLKFFPDRFHHIGANFICGCAVPLNKEFITLNSSPVFNLSLKVINGERDERSVLFVSQHLLHRPFFAFVKDFTKQMHQKDKDFKVLYKPHPGEYRMFDMAEVDELVKQHGLVFLAPEIDIYLCLAQTKNVAGVYSTVLLEAMENKADVFLMNIDGIEYFDYIIKEFNIPVFDNAAQLVDRLIA